VTYDFAQMLHMNIAVLLKQVHDPNIPRASLRVGADQRTLTFLAGANAVLNGYDANALEEALRIRARFAGTITALSVGGEATKDVLRRAIAMGADQAIHIAACAGLEGDGETVARLLCETLRTLDSVQLILAGRSASDTDAGVVPLLVAAYLNIPAITPVRGLSVEEHSLIAERITETGIRRVKIGGRAMIGVSNEINKPRSPQLKGVAASKRANIPTLTAAVLGVDVKSPGISLQRLFLSEQPQRTPEMISAPSASEAGRALAERLRQKNLI
jgi:electron transfer flavoprotein beta subunit